MTRNAARNLANNEENEYEQTAGISAKGGRFEDRFSDQLLTMALIEAEAERFQGSAEGLKR